MFGVCGLDFGVWGLRFEDLGLVFGVWDLRFGVRVSGFAFRRRDIGI